MRFCAKSILGKWWAKQDSRGLGIDSLHPPKVNFTQDPNREFSHRVLFVIKILQCRTFGPKSHLDHSKWINCKRSKDQFYVALQKKMEDNHAITFNLRFVGFEKCSLMVWIRQMLIDCKMTLIDKEETKSDTGETSSKEGDLLCC